MYHRCMKLYAILNSGEETLWIKDFSVEVKNTRIPQRFRPPNKYDISAMNSLHSLHIMSTDELKQTVALSAPLDTES